MSSESRPSGRGPHFRWVIAGKRHRLTLVRRVSLAFEIRREAAARQAELWLYAHDRVHRWSVRLDLRGAIPDGVRLAPELEPVATEALGTRHAPPPWWDRGRCVIETGSFASIDDALDSGELLLSLRGYRVIGVYRLSRTPMTVEGQRVWVIARAEAADEAGAS